MQLVRLPELWRAESSAQKAFHENKEKAVRKSINLNTATAEALSTLPGIGATTGEAIVEHRRRSGDFDSVGALTQVSGIGPATLKTISRLVCAKPMKREAEDIRTSNVRPMPKNVETRAGQYVPESADGGEQECLTRFPASATSSSGWNAVPLLWADFCLVQTLDAAQTSAKISMAGNPAFAFEHWQDLLTSTVSRLRAAQIETARCVLRN